MRIGDLHIHPVSDGTFIARPKYFGDDLPDDAHPELFPRHGTAWLPIGCFVVRTGDRVVLVDAPTCPIQLADPAWHSVADVDPARADRTATGSGGNSRTGTPSAPARTSPSSGSGGYCPEPAGAGSRDR